MALAAHEKPIKEEWKNLVGLYRQKGLFHSRSMEQAVKILNDVLFQKKEIDFQNIPTLNPLMITILENSVHKVIQEHSNHPYQDYFSVHYIFTKMCEESFFDLKTGPSAGLESFLDSLVTSKQLPIQFIAMVQKAGHQFIVKKIFTKALCGMDVDKAAMKAVSIFRLSELLHHHFVPEGEPMTIVPLPHEEAHLLICLPRDDAAKITPFLMLILEMYKGGQESVKRAKKAQQWKDSVILFNEKVMGSQTFVEAVENITNGFVEFLPFERCALFSYNRESHMGLGLYGRQFDNHAVKSIHEDIQNFPLVHSRLKLLESYGKKIKNVLPLYIGDVKGVFPDHYVRQFQLKSIVIAPIYLSASKKLLGAAILDQGAGKNFSIDRDTFFALIKFGQSAGEVLAKYYKESPQNGKWHFSPRELDVLKLLAEGMSTFEAAAELNLSEYTVRDYVSSIMKKMKVRNRTEAVARAIREGFI